MDGELHSDWGAEELDPDWIEDGADDDWTDEERHRGWMEYVCPAISCENNRPHKK